MYASGLSSVRVLPLRAVILRVSAWRGSKSVEARTISSPTCHCVASSTSIELLPASAVFASFVQLLVRLPCRFSVPPESMMPRSPMPIISSSFTLSVRVMVALRVCGPGLSADLQLPVNHDPLGGELQIRRVGKTELAHDRESTQRRRAHIEDDGLALGEW